MGRAERRRALKGELDMDELKKDLWEYGGVKFEEAEDDSK